METNMLDTWERPGAWALQWEGAALVDPPPAAESDRGQPPAWLGWRSLPAAEVTVRLSRNGNGQGAFPEVRSWALEWDGLALEGVA